MRVTYKPEIGNHFEGVTEHLLVGSGVRRADTAAIYRMFPNHAHCDSWDPVHIPNSSRKSKGLAMCLPMLTYSGQCPCSANQLAFEVQRTSMLSECGVPGVNVLNLASAYRPLALVEAPSRARRASGMRVCRVCQQVQVKSLFV